MHKMNNIKFAHQVSHWRKTNHKVHITRREGQTSCRWAKYVRPRPGPQNLERSGNPLDCPIDIRFAGHILCSNLYEPYMTQRIRIIANPGNININFKDWSIWGGKGIVITCLQKESISSFRRPCINDWDSPCVGQFNNSGGCKGKATSGCKIAF